ncbi:MAG: aldo/keto reductase [Asgard group archaeon]|nr:aldo/keto reductase [Asgard group archaeon]
MKYRLLGRTNLEVSEISLGTEWLEKKQEANITTVIQEAMNQGINYFDIIYNFKNYLKKISKAIGTKREDIVLTHHLGSSEYKGKYKKNRTINSTIEHFETYLDIMNTSYVDIAFIHFVHTSTEFDECWKEGGVKDLALDLQNEGKIQHIGMSTHRMGDAIRAVKSGIIDVIMIQINLANHGHPLRQEMLKTCANNGVGVVVMKPFAGGKLLKANRTVSFAKYQTANYSRPKQKLSENITSNQCIHYILNQVGVSTVVPGAANLDELKDCLSYNQATETEKDYSYLLKEFEDYQEGECVYCNHCQPCPADIDIGPMFRLYDQVQGPTNEKFKSQYSQFKAKASDCILCESCLDRCPFDIPVIEKMKEVAAFFEK